VTPARADRAGVRLEAADQDLAVKVYLPAGFVYADERQPSRRRPKMYLGVAADAPAGAGNLTPRTPCSGEQAREQRFRSAGRPGITVVE